MRTLAQVVSVFQTASQTVPQTSPAPQLLVFAGPNGSGKSTINQGVLADPNLAFTGEYINADDISKSLTQNFKNSTERNIHAAVLAETQRQKAIKQRADFAFETVMSTPEKIAIMAQARALGYRVNLVFITTDDAEINVQRVANRVRMGGHPVEPDAIRSRYHSTMNLLASALEHSDAAAIYDNTGASPIRVATWVNQQLVLHISRPIRAWVKQKLQRPFAARENSRHEISQALAEYCVHTHQPLPAHISQANAQHGNHYQGEIIVHTKYHALQKINPQHYVLHDLSLLAKQSLRRGRVATLVYAFDKGKISSPR
jgi:predicted ABC-type ATPase